MATDINDEATRYDAKPEATRPAAETPKPNATAPEAQPKTSAKTDKKTQSNWIGTAVGAGTGLLIGSVATILMGSAPAHADEPGNGHENLTHPEYVDDKVPVASGVNDDMSFGEAFAAARAEVGPGGCFEWHGQIYGTYTADEWNNMTAEQKAEYGDHFSWNKIDHSQSDVAQLSSSAETITAEIVNDNVVDDVQVVSVSHPHSDTVDDSEVSSVGGDTVEIVDVSPEDHDVTVLGVIHDPSSGSNIGGFEIDGQEVVVVDIDGDMEFDYMATDLNQNGQIDENEIVDIQGQGLTVDHLGGVSDMGADDMAGGIEGTDYMQDGFYEI